LSFFRCGERSPKKKRSITNLQLFFDFPRKNSRGY
jgi:hypothetical protein